MSSAIDLHFPEPDQFLARATPEDLLSATELLAAWDEPALEAADLLLVVWSARACSLPRGAEEIIALLKTLRFLLEELPNRTSLPIEYRHRWNGIRDLLESRRRALAHADPAATLARPHVREILTLIAAADETLSQSDLAARLKKQHKIELSDGRISQLLSQMQADELIVRQRHGRDKRLTITDAGRSAGNISSQTDELLIPAKAKDARRAGQDMPNSVSALALVWARPENQEYPQSRAARR